MEKDFKLIKLLLVGDSQVGKTSLNIRYVDGTFLEGPNVIGIDFRIKTIDEGDKRTKLQIWDYPANMEKFRTNEMCIYRGARGILVVFDVTNVVSYNNLKRWLQEIDRYAIEGVAVVIVGNKCELELSRVVNYKEIKEFANGFGYDYFDVSAKENINITQAFDTLRYKALISAENAAKAAKSQIESQNAHQATSTNSKGKNNNSQKSSKEQNSAPKIGGFLRNVIRKMFVREVDKSEIRYDEMKILRNMAESENPLIQLSVLETLLCLSSNCIHSTT